MMIVVILSGVVVFGFVFIMLRLRVVVFGFVIVMLRLRVVAIHVVIFTLLMGVMLVVCTVCISLLIKIRIAAIQPLTDWIGVIPSCLSSMIVPLIGVVVIRVGGQLL